MSALAQALTAMRNCVPVSEIGHAGDAAEVLMHVLMAACDRSMPLRKKEAAKRKDVSWWNPQLAEAKGNLSVAWRALQRARRKNTDCTFLLQNYRHFKTIFRRLVFTAKQDAWSKLCAEVDADPWGRPYRIIKKIGNPPPPMLDPTRVEEVINSLFVVSNIGLPTLLPPREDLGSWQELSMEELIRALRKIKPKKAPGLDGIPLVALRSYAQIDPEHLLSIYNKCMAQMIFPDIWKVQSLVLLQKDKKDADGRPTYRPISLLPICAKVLEHIVHNRLSEEWEQLGGFATNQFGFRKGRSTTDALMALRDLLVSVRVRKRKSILILIDIKNAFNSLVWPVIVKSLVDKGISRYLVNLIISYFKNRKLVYLGNKLIIKDIYAGVPQGSILGPFLWNCVFDDLLRMNMDGSTQLLAYADDLAIFVSATTRELVIRRAMEAYAKIYEWTKNHHLHIETQKTVAIQLSGLTSNPIVSLKLAGVDTMLVDNVKYLGVIIDKKGNFKEHVGHVCRKACKALERLNRILPNVGGPSQRSRRLLMGVPRAIIFYAIPVIAHIFKYKWACREFAAIQRQCGIRMCAAYRTVSGDALDVLTGSLPIALEAYKRKLRYVLRLDLERRGGLLQDLNTEMERVVGFTVRSVDDPATLDELFINKWQSLWDNSKNGRWTYSLINNIKKWINRKAGWLNYYTSQFFTGHGCFGAFLFRIGKESSPACWFCPAQQDTPYHTVFVCPNWSTERELIVHRIGSLPDPVRLVDWATRNEENWKAFSEFIKIILISKAKHERIRVLSGIRAPLRFN